MYLLQNFDLVVTCQHLCFSLHLFLLLRWLNLRGYVQWCEKISIGNKSHILAQIGLQCQEGLKIRGCQYYLVQIGLIYLQNLGGQMVPPAPPATTFLFFRYLIKGEKKFQIYHYAKKQQIGKNNFQKKTSMPAYQAPKRNEKYLGHRFQQSIPELRVLKFTIF